MTEENDWNTWSKYVLKEMERLNGCYTDLDSKLGQIREDIAGLKVKAGIWGIIGGSIPVIIMLAIKLIESK